MKVLKKDIILIITFIIIAIVLFIINFKNSEKGTSVEVTVSGESYGMFPLDKDGEYIITNGKKHNILVINNGTARISEATCNNQVCVKHKAISKDNETIICVPNKIVIKVVSESANELDGVAK